MGYWVRIVAALWVVVWGWGVVEETAAQCEEQIVIEASVDDATPYVGQQVIYTVRIENSTALSPVSQSPPFEGFWLAGSLAIRTGEAPGCNGANGVTINEKVLFPLTAGERIIPPGQLDFSSNPVYEASTTVISESVSVDVQPLPEGAPEGFTGAVGFFPLVQAAVASDALNQGDPVVLRVAVEGQGNIDQIDPPRLPVPDGWRVYGQVPRSNVAVSSSNQLYGGTKVFEWLLLPDVTGAVTIPPIDFSYFNPDVGVYETTQTASIPLTILPGAEPADAIPDVVAVPPEAEVAVPWEIKSGAIAASHRALSGWWLAVAPLSVLGAMGWQRYRRWQVYAKKARRRSGALKAARSRLAGAVKLRGDAAYQAVLRTVLMYFGDKWAMEPLALDVEEIQGRLIEAGVSGQVVDEVLQCVTAAQEGRYAPATERPLAPLARATLNALTAVDRSLT